MIQLERDDIARIGLLSSIIHTSPSPPYDDQNHPLVVAQNGELSSEFVRSENTQESWVNDGFMISMEQMTITNEDTFLSIAEVLSEASKEGLFQWRYADSRKNRQEEQSRFDSYTLRAPST